MGFFEKLNKQVKEIEEKKREKKETAKEEQLNKIELTKQRIAKMDEEGTPYCPKCFSASVSAQKKGFGLGKAIVGGVLLGPVGLLGGVIGKNKIKLYCLKCGNKFKA